MLRLLFILAFITSISSCTHNLYQSQFADENIFNVFEVNKDAEEQANKLFDDYYQFEIEHSPILRSKLGFSSQFEWDDLSREEQETRQEFYQQLRQQLKDINEASLGVETAISYRTLLEQVEFELLSIPFKQLAYQFDHLGGLHTEVVEVLAKHHPITSINDAHDYIRRMQAIPLLFKSWINRLQEQEESGVLAPAFVYGAVTDSIEQIITGAPFSNDGLSPLWYDFTSKLERLNLYPTTQSFLENKARNALLNNVKPAYQNLDQFIREQQARSTNNSGLSSYDEGLRYYQLLLSHYGNTQDDANYVHQLGLSEVTRIQNQIRQLASGLNYQGADNLTDMFTWLNKHYPKNRSEKLNEEEFVGIQRARLNAMAERLPAYFNQLPASPLAVLKVEPYRQKSAPITAYEPPSLDTNRPGIYYLNPSKAAELAHYRLATLAYHQAIPGHHLQQALAQENENLPAFRRIFSSPAFEQGWALYAQKLALEIGAYKSQEEEYGYLVCELIQAARLVLDTGINAKGWSMEQAGLFLLENTPLSQAEVRDEIRLVITQPATGVAAKLGELKILAIRQQVQDRLKGDFNLADFHTALLSQGALPLDILQDWMLYWAAQHKQGLANKK
ncbi:MAG: DUF885 domain-containing protein [Venatoribacter sp.]